MRARLPLLVFSDLDGTLLSHVDYSWEAARPALDVLADLGAGVVLASSKTAAEMTVLRDAIGLTDWPAIVENGSGLLAPKEKPKEPADDYSKIRAALAEIPESVSAPFRGFGDMDAAEVASVTGLPPADAARAKARRFSEPGIWSGTDAEKNAFLIALSAHLISAREGGRFLTLSFGQTKACRMAEITAEFAPQHTIALGDAPNDAEMLEAADYGVVVANPHRAPLRPLANENTDRIIRTTLPGPAGWNAAVLALVDRLNLN